MLNSSVHMFMRHPFIPFIFYFFHPFLLENRIVYFLLFILGIVNLQVILYKVNTQNINHFPLSQQYGETLKIYSIISFHFLQRKTSHMLGSTLSLCWQLLNYAKAKGMLNKWRERENLYLWKGRLNINISIFSTWSWFT